MCVQTIDSNLIKIVISQQKNRFEVVDLGEASHLLGLTIKRDEETGTTALSQETYARGVLEKFGMSDSRPTSTPAEVGPISTRDLLSTGLTTLFRAATGSLLYLSRCTRPDLCHSVMALTRCMSAPGKRALMKQKRVLRCLKRTLDVGIQYVRSQGPEDAVLSGLVD